MPNQDDRLPQEAEPQTIKSVPGYMAQAITLSDVGNNQIGIHFRLSEMVNPLHNRTYALSRKLAEDLYERLGAVLYS